MDLYRYPGARMDVSSPAKVTITPLSPGEVPPPGSTIIPPQSPVTAAMHTIHAAQQANVNLAKQAMESNQALAAQAAEAVNKVETETLTRAVQPPPWSVTFTEAR